MGVAVIEVYRLDNPDALEVLVLPGLISHLGPVLSAKVTPYLRSSIPSTPQATRQGADSSRPSPPMKAASRPSTRYRAIRYALTGGLSPR